MEDSGFGELSHSNTKWYARYKLKDALDHDTRHVPTEDATRTPVKAVPNNRYFDGVHETEKFEWGTRSPQCVMRVTGGHQ